MKTSLALLVATALVAAACTQPQTVTPAPAPSPAPVTPPPAPRPIPTATATATLRDPAGKQVGTLTLADTYAGLLITGSVSDLGLGAHAMHLHAVGRCEPPFTTAGGHFNPTNKQHGYKSANGWHLGDLPNLELPAAGAYRFEMLVSDVTLRGHNALLDTDGASIVIHSARDDYATDPAGNAGGRIACGVIIRR